MQQLSSVYLRRLHQPAFVHSWPSTCQAGFFTGWAILDSHILSQRAVPHTEGSPGAASLLYATAIYIHSPPFCLATVWASRRLLLGATVLVLTRRYSLFPLPRTLLLYISNSLKLYMCYHIQPRDYLVILYTHIWHLDQHGANRHDTCPRGHVSHFPRRHSKEACA